MKGGARPAPSGPASQSHVRATSSGRPHEASLSVCAATSVFSSIGLSSSRAWSISAGQYRMGMLLARFHSLTVEYLAPVAAETAGRPPRSLMMLTTGWGA